MDANEEVSDWKNLVCRQIMEFVRSPVNNFGLLIVLPYIILPFPDFWFRNQSLQFAFIRGCHPESGIQSGLRGRGTLPR